MTAEEKLSVEVAARFSNSNSGRSGRITTMLKEQFIAGALWQQDNQVESIERKIKVCVASINGALDGLQLDNTSDVIEKSIVIEQLKEQLNILQP